MPYALFMTLIEGSECRDVGRITHGLEGGEEKLLQQSQGAQLAEVVFVLLLPNTGRRVCKHEPSCPPLQSSLPLL